MNEYHVWGSQVIHVNDTYHMFASVYNASHDFFHNWLVDGFIVRATSDSPIGPFTYAATVLPQLAGRWDTNVMNPKLVQAKDGTFLLFYTGDANDQGTRCSCACCACFVMVTY
jgi:ubiquinone biosynthesis protein Coq4